MVLALMMIRYDAATATASGTSSSSSLYPSRPGLDLN
jgi:hypothetical protein